MRILYWTEQFWPYIGGVEVMGVDFVRALVGRGHAVTVVTSHGSLDLPDAEDRDGARIHRFPFLRALAERDIEAFDRCLRGVAAVKRETRPEVVHLRFTDPSVLFHLTSEREAPLPLLVSLELTLPRFEGGGGSLAGRVLRRADHVTAVSRASLEAARRIVPEITPRSSVVYNALSRERAPGIPEVEVTDRLACIGRLVDEKGFDLAIRALPRILRSRPGARLTIAGDGPARGALERLARRAGVEEAVEFPGWISPGAVADLIARSTVVVVPSRWEEAFCLVALEAALGSRPVVATRVGGLPEVVADTVTGLVVPPEDPDAIAQSVLALLRDPSSARALGSAAAERASRLFGFPRYLDAYEDLYHRIRDRRPAHAPA